MIDKPCPFCGTNVSKGLEDFVYPTDQSKLLWQAVCDNFACGALIYGLSFDNARKKWNDRTN